MKAATPSDELRETFRSIGRVLLDAEARYFWFGGLGVTAEADPENLTAQDFIKQSLVGIRTGDLESYLEELRALKSSSQSDIEALGIFREKKEIAAVGRWLALLWGETKRRSMFCESIHREIKRRHGETDDGDSPLPAGYSLRISGVSD